MDRLKSFRLTRRDLLKVTLAGSLASQACRSEISLNRTAGKPMPSLPPHPEEYIKPKPEPFDYCKKISGSSTELEKALAGTPVPMEEITRDPPKTPSPDDIDLMNITSASFIRSKFVDNSRFQGILIPVWYEQRQVKEKMEYIIDILRRAYLGVNVEFTYLNDSIKLGVKRNRQLVLFSDSSRSNRLINNIQKVHPVSAMLFVVNTNEYIGTCCPAIISGNNLKTGYLAVHEFAHNLGLADGHNTAYPSGDVNHESLFKRKEMLAGSVKRVVDELDPPLELTGNICGDEEVVSPYNPRKNIMMEYKPTDHELMEDLKRGGVFNPVQKALMNLNIDQKLAAARS